MSSRIVDRETKEDCFLEERVVDEQNVVAKNLQDSIYLMHLSDSENRHLIRIVEDSQTNYDDFDPFNCVYPYDSNKTIGRRIIATQLKVAPEKVLIEDEVYRYIEHLRHEIQGGYKKEGGWYKKAPPLFNQDMFTDNSEQKLGPKQELHPEVISVGIALDYILQFYRASMEARTMNERDYQGLKDGTSLFNRLLKRLKIIDEKISSELSSLEESWIKKGRDYEALKNKERRFDNLVQCAMNDFMYQFTRVYGKTPYQRLKEIKEKIEPLAYRFLDKDKRWNSNLR